MEIIRSNIGAGDRKNGEQWGNNNNSRSRSTTERCTTHQLQSVFKVCAVSGLLVMKLSTLLPAVADTALHHHFKVGFQSWNRSPASWSPFIWQAFLLFWKWEGPEAAYYVHRVLHSEPIIKCTLAGFRLRRNKGKHWVLVTYVQSKGNYCLIPSLISIRHVIFSDFCSWHMWWY